MRAAIFSIIYLVVSCDEKDIVWRMSYVLLKHVEIIKRSSPEIISIALLLFMCDKLTRK